MILIKNGTVWLGRERGFQEDTDVFIAGTEIAAVGRHLSPETPGEPVEVVDARHHLVLPGLVNAHCHAAMTLLRSYADDYPLQEWLTTKIWPLEARLTPEDVYWGAMLAIVEMVRAGVTAFADHYFFMDQVARAVEESGVRGSLALTLFAGQDFQAKLRETEAFAQRWHGAAGGRLQVMVGPHAPYTVPAAELGQVASLARHLDLPVHIHLSETRREVEESLARYGRSPIQVAAEAGLFDGPVLAAHCVHVGEADMEILRRPGVAVAHNPTANMKLGSGKAPVQDMIDRGILVALGTDGPASNNNLDLLEEARLAALLAKMDERPADLPAPLCIDMLTLHGAQALHFPKLGRIAPGYQGDVVLVDTRQPHWAPLHDPAANLIYSAHSRDVVTVIVAGSFIMRDGVLLTVDEERVRREATERGLRLRKAQEDAEGEPAAGEPGSGQAARG